MQNRFITRIIIILVIVFLGYWMFRGEKTSDHSKREVNDSIAENNTHEDDAGIELPKLKSILIRNDKKIAFFVDPASKRTGPFQIDDKVAEFIVSDIKNNKVILLRGNEEIEIELKDQKDILSDQSPSAETSLSGAPLRPISPPDIGSTDIPGMASQRTSKKTIQSGGYNKDEDAAPPEGSFNRHPATVGSPHNK